MTTVSARSARRSTPVVVLSTASSRAEGDRLANVLVAERLAACVNLVAPITSVYRWKNAIERAEEVLLVIKTRRDLLAPLGARLATLHSYDVPELLALPVVAGARRYLAWLLSATRRGRSAATASTARTCSGARPARRARRGRSRAVPR